MLRTVRLVALALVPSLAIAAVSACKKPEAAATADASPPEGSAPSVAPSSAAPVAPTAPVQASDDEVPSEIVKEKKTVKVTGAHVAIFDEAGAIVGESDCASRAAYDKSVAFFRAFVADLARNDEDAIVKRVQFPLETKGGSIANAKELKAKFMDVFPPKTRAAVFGVEAEAATCREGKTSFGAGDLVVLSPKPAIVAMGR